MDTKICQICNKEFTRIKGRSISTWLIAKFCSRSCYIQSIKGKPTPMEGLPSGFKGRQHTKEAIEKNRISHVGKIAWNKGIKVPQLSGEKHWFWQGGITPINKAARNTLEVKLWRKAVFERDNYTCQWCGVRGKELHADHIKPFCLFPELRSELSNGRTLCVDCHKQTDTYKRRALNYQTA